MSDEEENLHRENNTPVENFDPENTVKILIATDCHLGYERTTKRGLFILLIISKNFNCFSHSIS